MSGGHEFVNWSGTVKFRADRFVKPKDEAEVKAIVDRARADHHIVRVQGAGHSFSQIVTTPHVLMSLDEMKGVISHQGNDVTVKAGTRLKHLIPMLKGLGLGLKNMGSVTEQSIAGATSTGTHGTGIKHGSISTAIRAMRIVRGDGVIEDINGQSQPGLLGAARLSVGTFGVTTSLTLECVPYYHVDYDAYVTDFDRAVNDLMQLTQENERVLMWWFHLPPLPRGKVIIITKNTAPSQPTGTLAGAKDLTKGFLKLGRKKWYWPFKKVEQYDTPLPFGGDVIQSLAAFLGGGDGYTRILHRTGGYEEMLTIPLLPVFHRECEYAVPVANTKAALQAMNTLFREMDAKLLLPVEVRFVRGDDDMLAPTNKGDVCYIGASTLDNATEVFERFEPLMKQFGGRPHWGKHANLTLDEVKAMYPQHAQFLALRRARDPDGVFLNTLLRGFFA